MPSSHRWMKHGRKDNGLEALHIHKHLSVIGKEFVAPLKVLRDIGASTKKDNL
jgi:hypothetical protein